MNGANVMAETENKDFIKSLKTELMSSINDFHIKSENNQSQTAKLLGISQPKFSNISNYHTEKFSVENLINLISILNCAKIVVKVDNVEINNKEETK